MSKSGETLMDKIKVLLVLRDADGGMKKHVETVIKGLAKDVFYPVLACPENIRKIPNTKIYHIELGDKKSIPVILKTILKIAKIIRLEGIQLVHAHGIACCVASALASLLAGRPAVITTIHNFPENKTPGLYRRLCFWLAKNLIKTNRKIICVSQKLRDFLSVSWNIDPEKIALIHNGIDTSEILRLSKCKTATDDIPAKARPFILNISRLIPQKGVDTFIQAAKIVINHFSNSNNPGHLPLFLVAGDGPQREKLYSLAQKLEMRDNLLFLGFKKNIYSWINAADVVVLCSRSEGLGISLLESLCLKTPVIGSAVGGIPEIIVPNKTGILVPPDDCEALADAILFMLNNPQKAKAMAEDGYAIIMKKFSNEEMVARLEQVYLEVMKQKWLLSDLQLSSLENRI